MKYVGIDIGMRKCAVCVIDDNKKILLETTYDNKAEQAAACASAITSEYGPCKAVCEPTGNMWIKSFEAFEKAGIKIVLANTLKLKAISQASVKTDKIDAKVLARLLAADMIPTCHVPGSKVRGQKQILRHRIALVQDRTKVANRTGRLLDKYDIPLQSMKLASAKNLKLFKQEDFANSDDGFVIHQNIREIERIDEEIRAVEERIRKIALDNDDARRIMSMTGLDAFGALLLVLEIDGIERFSNPKKLVSWAGLCPTIHQSGKSLYHGHMKKDSNRRVNWMMIQAATTAVRCDKRMSRIYERASKGHPHQVAISHVATKMLTIIWHLLTNKTRYDGCNNELYARKLKNLTKQRKTDG